MFTCIFATHRNSTTLTTPYDGLYKVVARSGRVFKVLIKGKVETVTADLRISSARLKIYALDSQKRHRH